MACIERKARKRNDSDQIGKAKEREGKREENNKSEIASGKKAGMRPPRTERPTAERPREIRQCQ